MNQAFIQVLLLMSAFKQILSFQILYNEAGGLELLSGQTPALGGALVEFQ